MITNNILTPASLETLIKPKTQPTSDNKYCDKPHKNKSQRYSVGTTTKEQSAGTPFSPVPPATEQLSESIETVEDFKEQPCCHTWQQTLF